MKWHKFLVNFSLWASALLNVIVCTACLLNGHPAIALVVLGVAAYNVYARFQLANFKVKAYHHLLALQLIICATGILLSGLDVASIASSIAMCCVNYRYYKKRSELFVN